MVRSFLFGCVLLFAFGSSAQDNAFEYRKMLKATATLAPGYMFRASQTNIYVHGHLEYFPEDKISLRGDGFWFTGAQQKPPLLKENSSLFFGGLYHLHKNRLDFSIGLQAGMGFTRPENTIYHQVVVNGNVSSITEAQQEYKLKAVPIISPVTGLTFYAGKYVNFFLELRYVSGRYFGYTGGGTVYLDELRASAGLGFQIPLRKG